MRIDRLLGITIYLLNREKASSKKLSERFEVSRRTIQRDMEAIARAGIPVASTYGAGGGYSIIKSFRIEGHAAEDSDYTTIVTALKGLSTAFGNPRIDALLEKIISVAGRSAQRSEVVLDFGILRERESINEMLTLLEECISHKRGVAFDYTNADDVSGRVEAEPIVLTYKWYSWYLFAFCSAKMDYRLYKLCRIDNLSVTGRPFSQEHENAETLLSRHEESSRRKYIDIKLLCKAEVRTKALEYLNGNIEEEYENGEFLLTLHLPENEHMWFATLLALGNKAVVVEPAGLRLRLAQKAKEILEAYPDVF